MTMTLKANPSTTTPKRDSYVRLINQALKRAIQSPPGTPRVLQEAMAYCVFSGGKRFRPLLCLGGCEAVGGDVRRALSAACALELIHTYSLVHDDLPAMDDANERRGKPSCHKRYDEGTAILVGDALLTRAFELLASDGLPNGLAILRAVGVASGTSGLIGGQVLDLKPQLQPSTDAGTTLEHIAKRKTAALITASVAAGGLAGGASTAALKRLTRYGQDVGLAFQFKDDLHDGDGLVPVLGRKTVDANAQRLLTHADQALSSFGHRAWLLRELAQWLAKT